MRGGGVSPQTAQEPLGEIFSQPIKHGPLDGGRAFRGGGSERLHYKANTGF